MKDAIFELGELAKLLQLEKKEDFLQFESALNNAPIKKRNPKAAMRCNAKEDVTA